jgi:asparagine synthase (glutamine-hydrolysing)
MWAFAIWDREERRLFCSRDRFGIKPLYYRDEGHRLLFASEPRAFRADARPLAANDRVVRDFLEHALVEHTEETFFEGIMQLPAGHSLTFDEGGRRLFRYWQLEPRDPPAGDPAEAVREVFLDAVRLRLRSDVRVGTCLSGGLDSSAIACGVDMLLRTEAENARPVGDRQEVFTAYFEDPGIDERPYAAAVVEQIRAHSHLVSFSASELIEQLPAIVDAQGEPFRATSIAAQWYVMREAGRSALKVMLDGQGGDEILAGYQGYFGYLFADLLLRGRLRSLAGELAAYRTIHHASYATVTGALARPFVPPSLALKVRARANGSAALLHPRLRQASPPPLDTDSGFRDRLRRQLHFVLTRRLPELLRYEDRNAMTHSIEARLPFLDFRLVQLMFSLEPRQLIDRGQTKAVLRRAVGDLLPPPVRDRLDKVGFATPEGRWLRGPLGIFAAEVFRSREFRDRGFVDARAAEQRLNRHLSGADPAGFELWRALSLELWARAFLDA